MVKKTTQQKNEQNLGRDNTRNSKSKKQTNRITGSNSPVVKEMKIKLNSTGDRGEEVVSCIAGRKVNSQSTLNVIDRFCNFP